MLLTATLVIAAGGGTVASDGERDVVALFSLPLEDLLDERVQVSSTSLDAEVATKSAMSSADAPAVVTVLPRSMLLERGYRTVGEALADVPGFYVIDNLVTENVGTRGVFAGPDSWSRTLKFLVNGVPATYYPTAGALLGAAFIPIEAVLSIEVIRGPASALYGANAFLGVVNIVTRSALIGEPALECAGEVGVEGEGVSGGGSVFLAGFLDGAAETQIVVAASGGRANRSGVDVPADSPRASDYAGRSSEEDLSKPASAFMRMEWASSDYGRVIFQQLYQKLDAMAEFSDLSVLSHGSRIALSNAVSHLEYSSDDVMRRFLINAKATYTRSGSLPQQRLDVGSPSYRFARKTASDTVQASIEGHYRHDWLSVLVGGEQLQESHHPETVHQIASVASPRVAVGDRTVINRAPGRKMSTQSAFLLASGSAMSGALTGTVGLRYDNNNTWGSGYSARAAAVYELFDGFRVKALYGSSFVPPSRSQLDTATLRSVDGIQGNPDLEIQRANTYELAVVWLLERMSVKATTYFSQIDDRIIFVPVGDVQRARNMTSSSSYGAELEAEGRWYPFTATLGASYQLTEFEAPTPTPSWWRNVSNPSNPDSAAGYPTWQVVANVGLRLDDLGLQMNLGGRIVDQRQTSAFNARMARGIYYLDRYATLDAHVRTLDMHLFGERLTTLSLHGSNLLDADYAEAGYLGTDIPARRRILYLKLVQEI